jgi:hypothetical protein
MSRYSAEKSALEGSLGRELEGDNRWQSDLGKAAFNPASNALLGEWIFSGDGVEIFSIDPWPYPPQTSAPEIPWPGAVRVACVWYPRKAHTPR